MFGGGCQTHTRQLKGAKRVKGNRRRGKEEEELPFVAEIFRLVHCRLVVRRLLPAVPSYPSSTRLPLSTLSRSSLQSSRGTAVWVGRWVWMDTQRSGDLSRCRCRCMCVRVGVWMWWTGEQSRGETSKAEENDMGRDLRGLVRFGRKMCTRKNFFMEGRAGGGEGG
jgi:hypothetical protein